jgi:hypothetical protein
LLYRCVVLWRRDTRRTKTAFKNRPFFVFKNFELQNGNVLHFNFENKQGGRYRPVSQSLSSAKSVMGSVCVGVIITLEHIVLPRCCVNRNAIDPDLNVVVKDFFFRGIAQMCHLKTQDG